MKITLAPSELGDIHGNIVKRIHVLPRCSKEHGYVTGYRNISVHYPGTISRVTGNCIFDVDFDIDALKPEKGLRLLNCPIDLVCKECIFCRYGDMKILVPAAELAEKGWKYLNGKFVNQTSNECLMKNKVVDIEIDIVRYFQKQYHCIAKLV